MRILKNEKTKTAEHDIVEQSSISKNNNIAMLRSQLIKTPLELNIEGIATGLKVLPNWLMWKAVPKENGKINKVPFYIKDGQPISGGQDNINVCMTFESVLKYFKKFGFNGIGFTFDGKGIVGIDIDNCIINGKFTDEAIKIINQFKDTYIEISQSGKGIHIFFFDNDIANGYRLKKHRRGGFEVYEISRYFATTGNRVEGTGDSIKTYDGATKKFVNDYIDVQPAQHKEEIQKNSFNTPSALSDDELLKVTKNDSIFQKLFFQGDFSSYPSQSEADIALMIKLAFYTKGDTVRMEKLFSQSALGQRDKWQRQDYRQSTIENAISVVEKNKSNAKNTNNNKLELNAAQRQVLFNKTTADLDNARKIIEIYGDKIRYITDLDRWATFKVPVWNIATAAKNSTIYPFVSELYNLMQANANCKSEYDVAKVFKSRQKVSNAVEMCKAFPQILIQSKKFNQNPMLLNCPNGIIDLETGKLHPHDSNLLFTQCTGAEYRPKYHSENVEKFLHSILPNEEILLALTIYLGYSLTGSVKHDRALFIHGSGRNGKGSLMDSLMRCLGDFATPIRNSVVLQSRKIDDGETATPELAKLEGKRLAILDELPAGRVLDEAKFKSLTGGDQIPVRKLRCDSTTIENPTHKLILSGNFLPEIKDTRDIAISERLLVIKFEQSFLGEKCNPQVRENLKKPEALSGLLTLLVQACLEWQKLGKLFEPDSVKNFKREYLDENDIVGEFIDSNCKRGADLSINCKDFIKQLKNSSGAAATMSDKAIIAAVEKMDGISKYRMKQGRVFRGIAWLDNNIEK